MIDSVEQLKEASKAVSDAVDATTAARGRIDASFDSYRPASTRAALLYALVGSLPRLNPYYRLSFAAFSQCLQRALRGTDPTEVCDYSIVYRRVLIDGSPTGGTLRRG